LTPTASFGLKSNASSYVLLNCCLFAGCVGAAGEDLASRGIDPWLDGRAGLHGLLGHGELLFLSQYLLRIVLLVVSGGKLFQEVRGVMATDLGEVERSLARCLRGVDRRGEEKTSLDFTDTYNLRTSRQKTRRREDTAPKRFQSINITELLVYPGNGVLAATDPCRSCGSLRMSSMAMSFVIVMIIVAKRSPSPHGQGIVPTGCQIRSVQGW
jgi:hypothetical protein